MSSCRVVGRRVGVFTSVRLWSVGSVVYTVHYVCYTLHIHTYASCRLALCILSLSPSLPRLPHPLSDSEIISSSVRPLSLYGVVLSYILIESKVIDSIGLMDFYVPQGRLLCGGRGARAHMWGALSLKMVLACKLILTT